MFKDVFYILLIIFGVLGIAASIVSVLISTGIGWGTIFPGATGIVLITYALIHILHPGNIIKIEPLRIAVIAVVLFGILTFVGVETTILVYQYSCSPAKGANFVIVPGCGVFPDGRLTLTLKDRLDTAFGYITEHKNMVCIVSGGKGKNEPCPEAQAMKEYLVSKGIPAARIIEEPNSEDTLANMANSSALIDKLYPGKEKSAVIVTSGFHIFRSMFLAKNNGIEASALSAPSPWYLAINNYMREYIGVVHSAVFELK